YVVILAFELVERSAVELLVRDDILLGLLPFEEGVRLLVAQVEETPLDRIEFLRAGRPRGGESDLGLLLLVERGGRLMGDLRVRLFQLRPVFGGLLRLAPRLFERLLGVLRALGGVGRFLYRVPV